MHALITTAEVKILASRWLPPILWAGIIFWLSSIPDLRSDLPTVWDFILRKIGHVAEFGVLTLFILRAVQPLNRQKILAAALSSLLYAISDEMHQRFIPGRDGAASDVIIDAIGIALAFLYATIKIKQKPR